MKRTLTLLCGLLMLVGVLTAPTASASSVVTCTWGTPEYPHISSYNLRNNNAIDIKTSVQGTCNPSPDPLSVTATMTLERQGFLGFWSTVATGAPITKSIQGTGQIWRRGELMAVMPCVPGVYRGSLSRSAQVEGGIAFILGEDIHSPAREIDCKPKKVSMVIDDTGSMSGVINGVSSALTGYIDAQPEDEYTQWSLTTFKDSPTDVGTTEDRAQALSWVNALTASGGDDCPEDVLGGISNGLATLGSDPGTDKQMLVATDASAQGGDVDGIIANAKATGVRVNVLLAGDCGMSAASVRSTTTATTTAAVTGPLSSQVVLKRIAEETGGKYFYIPSGTQADFAAALDEIFAEIANPTPTDDTPPVLQLSVSPAKLWPPNHKMVEITPTVTATDDTDPAPRVELVGVTVNQADDGQGDGATSNDVQVTDDGHVSVRAERSAPHGVRVYTITYRATDASGNVGFASADVVVAR